MVLGILLLYFLFIYCEFKTWLRGKGGINRAVLAEYTCEYEWRCNTRGRDRFFALLSAIELAGLEP